MTTRQMILVLGLTIGLAGVAYVAHTAESGGDKMTTATQKFLASLKPEQKAKAAFKFDDAERLHWWFTPQQKGGKSTRKGLPLEEMTDDQKRIVLDMLHGGTSKGGFDRAVTIMTLEDVLLAYEKGKGPVRNKLWYFVSVFGTPSKTGKWGWRIEGHHLSLSFTVDSGKIISATPNVFAANPAEVMSGKSKGLRALGESIDLYKKMLAALGDEGRGKAKQPKLFPEIHENEPKPSVGKAVGLAAGKMTEKQQAALWKLIEAYSSRMPDDVSAAEVKRIKDAGFDKVHFAYGGSEGTPGKPYSYRIQGPTFVIEFLNEQADAAKNPANHIHSAWRNMEGDFGMTK